jgi:hypothetical protein
VEQALRPAVQAIAIWPLGPEVSFIPVRKFGQF